MNTELREFIEQAQFCRASVQRVAELLPPDEMELDGVIAETVHENNPKALLHVLVAALGGGRRVEAKHLTTGATLLGHAMWLGSILMKVQGEMPEPVLAAMENSRFAQHIEAAALLVIQDWCREQRAGKLPEAFFPIARRLARNSTLPAEAQAYLITVALRTNDAGMLTLVRAWLPKAKPEQRAAVEKAGLAMAEAFLQNCRLPILNLVGEKTSNALAQGTTMRRAVAKVGRNDPCPCGSGKKYKHCCIEKDNERLHHSSAVAGVTAEELHADLNKHLTAEILNRTQPHEMLLLDPLKVPADLLKNYFLRLAAFNQFERATEAFQKIGFADEAMEANWESVMFFAIRAGRKEMVQQLIKVREESVKDSDEQIGIPLSAALLLENDNPPRTLQLMDDFARDVLDSEDLNHLKQLAAGLIYSPHRALGILVARGVIPLLPSSEAMKVLDQILEARDVLNLPPDDPFGDIADQRYAEHEEDDAKLRAARQSMEAKSGEVRELKEKLEGFQAEIARQEKKLADTAAAQPALEAAVLKELRRKVDELKSELSERHGDRNRLRRELQKAHDNLESFRQSATASPDEEAEASRREDELLLPQSAPEVHPVRLAEYPKHFLQTLEGLPRPVARAAVIMIGRLAAGEPAAFVGALRLRATPNVMRQRIGINYRLLFRLWPGRLEVIDLVNRKDLDRRIKSLI
jgi:SEC-C motif